MLMENMVKRLALHNDSHPIGITVQANLQNEWEDFLERLRFPECCDAEFFLVLKIDSQTIYLDDVTMTSDGIGGYDVLAQLYRFVGVVTDLARCVLDFGYLENGVLKHATILRELIAESDDFCPSEFDFILKQQIKVDDDVYAHFLDIARRSDDALAKISQGLAHEFHDVPFEYVGRHLHSFCPIGYAVALDFIEYVRSAVGKGISLGVQSIDGETLTHIAALHSSENVLRTLLAGGAPFNDLDTEGFSPIEIAVQNKFKQKLECLLSANADPNVGLSPAQFRYEHAVALNDLPYPIYLRLRRAGTRFDIMTNSGETPLHLNASRFRRDTFVAMVKDGLDPNMADDEGESPFDRLRRDVPAPIFENALRECQC